ncbi:HAMP domain-containing histidine kinase [Heyndrickxia oleronia]|uniref:sensor histidine kinase n=1 Tax=Heyndrickxia oleronia TaxID=38875 RepID=UPI00204095DE|nr:HAMP domain-containing sensor histidine kinase [Heyndrickxia oleronia]MCM3239228.1 HAMP domain-containing histidine kinase [Heyndrickxia oleronia]
MFKKRNKSVSSKSIKTRLVGNFIIIILISVLVFEALLIYFTRYYFYHNVENVLTNQIRISSDFYSKYFSNVPLEENVIDNVDVFWQQTNAQVQIVDLKGRVLLDSIGVENKQTLGSSDFYDALAGKKGVSIGKVDYGREKVMTVSYPLKSDEEVVGVLRFITSLSAVDKVIRNITLIFISIGIVVIVITGAIGLILSSSIVLPLREVTNAAEIMAGGNLEIRIKKNRNDEIGKLVDTLNYMAEEIKKREEIKDDFISLVSHELRTPLTSIKGWASTLSRVDRNETKIFDDGLTIIEKESDRLAIMVEELLDFSSFASGKISLNKKKTDLKDIFYFIEKQMRPKAMREGIHFQVECEELPLIELDGDRIKQVLINLLGNALKFTPPDGTVSLRGFMEKDAVIMSVIDTGCGISKEELPRITEKFYKGKNSKAHTGLGLSICDEIVKLHKGSLQFKSEVNVGTEVIVKLPLEINHTGVS